MPVCGEQSLPDSPVGLGSENKRGKSKTREFSLKETGQTFTLRCLAHRAGFGDGECGFAGGCDMRFKRVIHANLDGLKLGHDRRKDFLLSKVSSG